MRTNCDLKSETYASENFFGREAGIAPHRICAIFEFRLYFRDIAIRITPMAIVWMGLLLEYNSGLLRRATLNGKFIGYESM